MWLSLLQNAVGNSNKTAAADELGVSRPYVSRVLNGNIPLDLVSPRFIERVMKTYGRVECPFTGSEITLAECKTHHTSAVPTSSPRAMKHWRACQGCPNNTSVKE